MKAQLYKHTGSYLFDRTHLCTLKPKQDFPVFSAAVWFGETMIEISRSDAARIIRKNRKEAK